MSALAVVARSARSSSGGVPARRAIVRWTWRLLRRDWRQQVLVFVLVTLTVAACLLAIIAVFNGPKTSAATMGNADHRIMVTTHDPSALAGVISELDGQFGPLEVITHEPVPVPGSVETVELRTQVLDGPLGSPMLALRSGRYPTASDEVAVTDGAAESLGLTTGGLKIGEATTIDGVSRTVVGRVENPQNLDDEFILAPPSAVTAPTGATLLVSGHHDVLNNGPRRITGLRVPDDRVSATYETRDDGLRGTSATIMLVLDTVALLLVSLVAAASFVVIAQRRLRQIGMLAAIGATNRHLRLAMVAHGAAMGILTAIVGNTFALLVWFTSSGRLEPLIHHRVDSGDLPLMLMLLGSTLAVLTTTAAAWWPARAVARVPIIRALSGRPPATRRVHRSLAAALAFLAAGVLLLVFGINGAGEAQPVAVMAGPIAVVLGILFLCPVALRILSPVATRLPITARLALRDLVRFQARAGGALAAISLGLGIACTTIVITAAATPPATAGNLSNRQVLFQLSSREGVPEIGADELQRLDTDVQSFAASVNGVAYPLVAAVSQAAAAGNGKPIVRDPGEDLGLPPILVGERIDDHQGVSITDRPYVATPELLAMLEIDPTTISADVELLTPVAKPYVFADMSASRRDLATIPIAHTMVIPDPEYDDVPQVLITQATLEAHGWVALPVGWFIEAGRTLTAADRSGARELAADRGIVAETRDAHHALGVTRSAATAGGMLLALGIIAMSIGLIRGEATRDLQTLTAAGATSISRRTITGVTAAALAMLGALLGLAGAYTALIAGFSDDLHTLTRVPVVHLLTIVFGLPVLAGIGGWLLAGREPPAITRQALE